MSLARRVSQKKPKLPSTGFRDSWVADLPLPPDGVKWQWNETIERGLGVALRISHHGTRSWKAVTYDGANKPVPVTVGAWPEMNTQAAKEAARCHRLNPRSHQQAKDAGTWAETCERYLAAIEAEGKHTTHQIKTKLARYVLPSRARGDSSTSWAAT